MIFLGVPVRFRTIVKFLGFLILGGAVILAGPLAGCAARSSSENPDDGRPPVVYTQPAPTVTGASNTMTAAPSAAPSSSRPATSASASASESSDVSARPGKVVAMFEDGPQGPFLVLAPMDESRSDLEYASKQRDALRELDVTALPIASAWKVNVSMDEFASYKLFAVYPSSGDTALSSTNR